MLPETVDGPCFTRLSLNVYIIYARFCRNKRQIQPWINFNKNNAINVH